MEIEDDDFEDLLPSDDMLDFPSQEYYVHAIPSIFYESEGDLYDTDDDGMIDEYHGDDDLDLLDDGDVDAPHTIFDGDAKSAKASTATTTNAKPSPKSQPRARTKADLRHRVDHAVQAVKIMRSPRDQIEAIFQAISRNLNNEEPELEVSLNMRPRQMLSRSTPSDQQAKVRTKRLCFPGRTEDEAWRFTVVIRILELIHGALVAGITISKRDIYYRDVALFGHQRHVDRYVDDIAFTFGVPRAALNVTAVAKGLVTGAVFFCRRDGSTISAASDREGMLVPNLKDVLAVNLTAVRWIIVIEKEASFRSLAASDFWHRLSSEGVLITGKGYPDIATRALLRYLCTPSPQNGFASPPCFALVDYDPDGLAIMSVYTHGSVALAHESDELRVPRLKWMGLNNEHLSFAAMDVHASQGLLALTARDRAKARKLLERAMGQESTSYDEEICAALRTMLILGVKAELQLLDATPDGMARMVSERLESLGP
ncbi:hypothetical protein LTR62_008497 [Meristemomyces frigidus]|uniref:DNA topoisomerase (ATP-hydrolyzing) n=1 Tax=Meristemomyces frigidus TaxID=1508187 RepID=A0AAN7TPJ8_9PEZI|nr:hypothetical protein LTR62_008497 [Meristemomyces frigidus]